MNFISKYFERRRRYKEDLARRQDEFNEEFKAEQIREEAERAAWWGSLTPEQKHDHLRQEQLDRIERKMDAIRRHQQYDPDDYDII